MPKFGLTPLQKKCLDFIRKYIQETNGISPSYDEINLGVGLNSKGSTYRVVTCLEQRGYIARVANASRSIIVLD